jgi:hypothetical protein
MTIQDKEEFIHNKYKSSGLGGIMLMMIRDSLLTENEHSKLIKLYRTDKDYKKCKMLLMY